MPDMFKSIIIRNFATAIKKTKPKPKNLTAKGRAVKNLNYENKALFGAVVKKENDATAPLKPSKSNQTESASEMHWLLQSENPFRKHIRSSNNDSKIHINHSPPSHGLTIPFSDKELRSVLTFPLVPTANGTLERTWTRHEQFETDQYKSPSVSKILSSTMPEAARQALFKWKASKIALLGEEGFAEFQKATLERGSNLHSCLESWLNNEEIDRERLDKARELWTSIHGSLERVERPARVIERKIYHPFLHYNGVVDCISSLDKKLHIIEWKTSEKQKSSLSATYDAPVQLCAYLGALKTEPEFSGLEITDGAVFVAYTTGDPAHVHLINSVKLKKYWALWLRRLQEYWIRYRDETLPEPI
ncbi:mitochondrial genome maintenance exonuclease 1-like [Ochlerotatus camptorhynchus]|uniref:mitochondrial genome maintenance exonuclease 1-like n=1 Tax=Ochlerotatus camptorhynchus TaxID=644619 RepID=UPI0031DF800B